MRKGLFLVLVLGAMCAVSTSGRAAPDTHEKDAMFRESKEIKLTAVDVPVLEYQCHYIDHAYNVSRIAVIPAVEYPVFVVDPQPVPKYHNENVKIKNVPIDLRRYSPQKLC